MSSVQCYLYGSGAASGTVAKMDTYHTVGSEGAAAWCGSV